MRVQIFLSFFAIQILSRIAAEIFTSNEHLQYVLFAERDIADLLRRYAIQEEMRLESIRKLADDYENHANNALSDISSYLGNPVNAFLLIKRFTLDWDKNVSPVVYNNTWDSMFDEFKRRTILPSSEDLAGAVIALNRLHDTYLLDTSMMANGNLNGIPSPLLTENECYELSQLAYKEGDFHHASLWMEQAFTKRERTMPITGGCNDQKCVEIIDFLAYFHYKSGNIPLALHLTNTIIDIDPNHESANNNKRYFEAVMADEGWLQTLSKGPEKSNKDLFRASQKFLNYAALCRGEDIKPLKDANKFTCRYVTNNHPLLILRPAKEETQHLDPFVVIYHDVLSNDEIDTIKRLATPKLNRSATIINSVTGDVGYDDYRISKSIWLRNKDSEVVKRFHDRIQAITGLNMEAAEDLQVANYGLAGHFEPHYDFEDKESKNAFKSINAGNRIATFLNYLSDVEAGGATVFPEIGVKVFPKKGSAAFWYNMHRNGTVDYNTMHAACPVLVGTKWVANSWIHEWGQEFRRPCAVDALA